ncbi:hypothetical protein ESCOCP328B_26680 [Escherichia coli]
MPNHDRFECQTAIDSDAILHSPVLLQKLQLTQGTDILSGLFDTGQQCCRIRSILIVVKDNSRFAVDIVL